MRAAAALRQGAAALLVALSACRTAPARLPLLDEILRSGNDNDPRLDTAFRGLSASEKRSFRERYAALPREARAGRGLVVYLLGQNLSAPEDWAFLEAVVAEPACLSVSDCAKPGGEADEVTLAYPALVALRQARRALDAGAAEAERVLDAGKSSPAPAARRLAERLSR